MLALKTLAAADHPGKTLIFDEVDAGIGGRAATVVGQKLQALGQRFQVLCITHLPQIAAAGIVPLSDREARSGKRTATSVARLSGEDRVAELARMMGGGTAGPQAKAGARELLTAASGRQPWRPGRKAKAREGESESKMGSGRNSCRAGQAPRYTRRCINIRT